MEDVHVCMHANVCVLACMCMYELEKNWQLPFVDLKSIETVTRYTNNPIQFAVLIINPFIARQKQQKNF